MEHSCWNSQSLNPLGTTPLFFSAPRRFYGRTDCIPSHRDFFLYMQSMTCHPRAAALGTLAQMAGAARTAGRPCTALRAGPLFFLSCLTVHYIYLKCLFIEFGEIRPNGIREKACEREASQQISSLPAVSAAPVSLMVSSTAYKCCSTAYSLLRTPAPRIAYRIEDLETNRHSCGWPYLKSLASACLRTWPARAPTV